MALPGIASSEGQLNSNQDGCLEEIEPKYHTATRTMRSGSPFVLKNKKRKKGYSRYMHMESGPEKINRILLDSQVDVEILGSLSPSCIWVRLFTNQMEECVVNLKKQKYYLEPLETEAQLYSYYMAPRLIELTDDVERTREVELVYARVRLLRIKSRKSDKSQKITDKCYVFYIDYGDSGWVMKESLAKIPKNLLNVPWQATPISLFGVSPGHDAKSESVWSAEHCRVLREVISELSGFEFSVRPFISKHFGRSSYEDYARVLLEGYPPDKESSIDITDEKGDAKLDENEEDSEPISIALQFYNRCLLKGLPIKHDRGQNEASETQLYGVLEKEEIHKPPSTKRFPTELCQFDERFSNDQVVEKYSYQYIKNLKRAISNKITERRNDNSGLIHNYKSEIDNMRAYLEESKEKSFNLWDPNLKDSGFKSPQIEPITREYLKSKKFIRRKDKVDSITISLIDFDDCFTSPHEIYGRFTKNKRAKESLKEISKIEDECDLWQEKLNVFYSLRSNWKPFNPKAIEDEFNQCKRIFGIYALTDETNQIDMCRVQVIALQGADHLVIRLLDRGGRMTVDKHSLFHMHTIHAAEPPKAVQFCLHGVVPTDTDERRGCEIWSKNQCKTFCQIVRSDTLMRCNLKKIQNHKKDIVWYELGHSHLLTEVFYVSDLRVLENESSENSIEKSVEESLIDEHVANEGDCEEIKSQITYCQ